MQLSGGERLSEGQRAPFQKHFEIANGESTPIQAHQLSESVSLIQQSLWRDPLEGKRRLSLAGSTPMAQVSLRLAGQRGRQALPEKGEGKVKPVTNAGAPADTAPTHNYITHLRKAAGWPWRDAAGPVHQP